MSSLPKQKSAARLYAVQAVYQMIVSGTSASRVIEDFRATRIGREPELEGLEKPDMEMFSGIVGGVARRQDELQDMLAGHLREGLLVGDLADKDPLLLAILLCGGVELMAHPEIDAPIIISDYLNITHAYYQGQESRMVNGILDSLGKLLRASPAV